MMNVFRVCLVVCFYFNVSLSQHYHCPYLPMALGKTWLYTSTDTPDTLVSSITDTATIQGRFYYYFAPYGDNNSWPHYWLRPEPQKIYALNTDDSTEYLLFDFLAEQGQSWPIPAVLQPHNLPVNQCDWGSSISAAGMSDSIFNSNRTFYFCHHFSHRNHPCNDAGMYETWFSKDFGIVRFEQITEGGVVTWDLQVARPDTTLITGEYTIVGNPCLTSPCLPGVVSAVKANNVVYILSHKNALYYGGAFSWNDFQPSMGDSICVEGIITERLDGFGKTYITIDIVDCYQYVTTSVVHRGSLGCAYKLEQNYPNPFNPETKIVYYLSEAGDVRLVVYDTAGRHLKTLVKAYQHKGRYEILLDGRDLPSGVYFYRLFVNERVRTKTMVLIK